jgi:hypothetical protein
MLSTEGSESKVTASLTFLLKKLACRMRELELQLKKVRAWLNVEMRETWLVSVCSGR